LKKVTSGIVFAKSVSSFENVARSVVPLCCHGSVS